MRTHHFPFTLIKHLKPLSSPPLPSPRFVPKGSKISNLELSELIAISVSGIGIGDGEGAYERSPGVKPVGGSVGPDGGVKRKGPDGVCKVSVVGLKFRSPENAI
jgi:hypothetical protein